MLVSTNEMTHLIGLAKAQEMGDCVKFPHQTKA